MDKPSMRFPISETLTHAIKYLRALLSSTDSSHWLSLCQKIMLSHGTDHPVAPRWQILL